MNIQYSAFKISGYPRSLLLSIKSAMYDFISFGFIRENTRKSYRRLLYDNIEHTQKKELSMSFLGLTADAVWAGSP